MGKNTSPLQFNGSFTELPTEQSMFDLEDENGRIDRTPIDRFGHYNQYTTPLNQSFMLTAQIEGTDFHLTVEQPTASKDLSSVATFYANLMNKSNKKKSLVTPTQIRQS